MTHLVLEVIVLDRSSCVSCAIAALLAMVLLGDTGDQPKLGTHRFGLFHEELRVTWPGCADHASS